MHRHSPPCPTVFSGVVALFAVLGFGALAAGDEKPFAAILQPLVDESAMSGAVVLVANRDRVLDVESIGFSSLEAQEPMQNDALFWIASMTKSVTATALMMLVDEGKVAIGDPVEKYLPEFKGQLVSEDDGQTPPHPPGHPITVKEILSHTSGLVFPNSPLLHPVPTLAEEVAQIAAAPLRREPGTKYEYNNCGINAAGRLVEVVSGLPYGEFLQTRLLDPLEMKETTFWPTEEQAQRLARSSRRAVDGKTLEDTHQDAGRPEAELERLHEKTGVSRRLFADFGLGKVSDYANHFAMPAGGLFSTAGDLGKFCQMLLNRGLYHGRRYLSEAAIAQMTANQTADIPVNPEEAYGLGWSVKTRSDDGPSPGSFGHRGARRTAMWIDPANQLVMIVMLSRMDMTGAEQERLYRGFMKAAVARYGAAHP